MMSRSPVGRWGSLGDQRCGELGELWAIDYLLIVRLRLFVEVKSYFRKVVNKSKLLANHWSPVLLL